MNQDNILDNKKQQVTKALLIIHNNIIENKILKI